MQSPNPSIVITSIFAPTAAVESFSKQGGWQLIVVGDKKTPIDRRHNGVRFLPASEQESSEYRIAKLLPWNHYCRKMLGYVHAIKAGAKIIADADDDNIPKGNWTFPDFNGIYDVTKLDLGFVNVYKSFADEHIWPRGFPLNLITYPKAIVWGEDVTRKQVQVGVWQGLADGDPDVDALYRLTSNKPCYFRERPPLVLAKGTLCPFNSQNTAFRHELFPLMYLPAFVTFRFTDILRGLIAQPIMWNEGYTLGFTSASVVQERNPHDYLDDFESEMPCYLYPERVIDVVSGCIKSGKSLADNLYNAYEALCADQIVPPKELPVLSAWLEDLE